MWIHAGEHRAINLRHVSAVEFEQGPVLTAHLYLTSLDASSLEELGARRVTVEGPEAEGYQLGTRSSAARSHRARSAAAA